MPMMSLFANPVGWDFVDIDNSLVEDYCYEQYRNFPDNRKVFGYQSELVDLEDFRLLDLVDEIKIRLAEVTKIYQIKQEFAPALTTSWININKPNGRMLENNVCHLHPGRFFSFVYYVKAEPNSGGLDLLSPQRDLMGYSIPNQIYEGFNPVNSLKWTIQPEPKKLVMFPGWIQHQASMNQSTEDRISIAFNADLQNLDKIYYPPRLNYPEISEDDIFKDNE